VRIGLGYVKGVREHEVTALVASREQGGPFRSLSDLASRAGAGASSLELLAWAGACDSLARAGEQRAVASDSPTTGRSASARRVALWQLGVASPGRAVPGGVQLALPLDLPAPPPLRELSEWESMAADYATSGLTAHVHPLALLRDNLPADAVTSLDLERLAHGTRVKVAGLVVARQRPGTAGGIVFVLLEDEHGTINLIIPSQIYDRHRLTVRTEPLMIVEGKLERFAAAGGSINVLVDQVGSVVAPDRPLAEVKDFSLLDEQVRRGLAEQRGGGPPRQPTADDQAAEGPAPAALDDFRAVAPPAMSFASGRRR
jgi:error-prone DNA polymerase